MGGDDNITGNGNTRISYVNASDGVTVDLALPTVGVPGSTGIAHGSASGDLAGIGTDTIFGGVNSIVGSSFADTLSGSNNGFSSSEVFDGGAGNDTFDGRGGFDQAVYNFDLGTAVGITVNMASVNTAVGTVVGDASIGTDTLTSIESVRGTNFADTYVATGYNGASADIPNGTTFNEFEGLGGNDTITGNGNTRISYVSATDGVTVDLAAGTASGNASVGTDMFTGVTRARGSSFTDMISGDSSNNVLDGQGGNDVLDGRSGSDTLIGGGGSDQFFYSAGTDTITDFDQSAGSFNHAEGDVIDLVGSGWSGVTNWTQLQLIMSQNGADTLINFGGGNTMTLSNVTLSNLTQNDFTFSAPISGDLAVSVNNGGIIVLTPSDLHAVDPNSTTGQLTFTVSVPTHGYIAFAANPGIAITSFTEADLEAGHVLFVHDGSNTNTAQATFKVSVSDGITSSAATTIIASVPAVTIQVLTANGMDFNDGDPIKPMGAGQLQPTLTPAAQITIINTAANLKFVFEGVGLTLNNDSSPTAITGGTITAIHAFTNDLTPVALYDIAVNVAAVTWYNAIVADAAGNSSLFDTLTNGWSINFVGGAGPDEAASTDLNDFFRSSGGSDFFDGQFGIDRADYTHAPGAINVQLADGTVTKFTDGNATLIDDVDTLRSVELVTGTNFVDFFNAGPTANNPSGFSGNSTNAGSATGSNSGTFNEFQGRGGNDFIIGNGSTRISFMGATAGVTVDFAAQTLSSASVFGPAGTVVGHSFGTAPGDLAGVGTDTFVGVNSVRGSYFDDFLFGSNNPFNTFENFEGRGGNDSIDGRGGFDRAVYANEDFHISVQLAAGIVTGGLNTGTDILHSIEAIAGTDFDDTYDATGFTGSGATTPSSNSGNSGPSGASSDFNEFEGRGGDDSITGNGNTRVAFYNATAGVTVTLGANGSGTSFGTAPDNPAGLATNPIDLAGVGNDIFVSGVSRVRGSEFGDVITGNGGNNTLEGQGGADILNGRGGNDTLTGGTGSDIFMYNNNVTNGNSPPSNNDIVTDFNDSEADRIDLRGVSGINTFADVLAHVPIGSPNAIQVDASDSLTLNVPISSLQASDFIFTGQVAMTVQTSDGYNFSTLYDDMAGSIGAVSVVDSSHFTATNSTRGLVFSMTVSGDTTPGNPLTGTVNAIDIYDLTGHIQATSNGWNFLASDLNNALQTYAANHSLTSGLDAIFSTVSYNAVGNFVGNNQFNNSSVNFGGDTFVSGAGNDVFNGLTNANGDFNNGDTVDYSDALAGVTVSLLSPGTPQPTGGAGTDTLINIENLRGSSHNDTLTSNGFNSVLEGGPGNDNLIGQVGGSETVSYEHATGPVTVNLLVTAPQNTIGAGTDTISNFEAVRGSAFNDTLTGNGNSVLEGGPGADQLIGQFLGSDTASYQHATASVTVNLLNSALNAGDAAGDTFVFISNVQGSQFNDTLIGDNNNNVLNGWGTHDNGGDVLTGNGGADNFVFSGGRVTVTDFHHADGDKIDLSNLNFGAGVTDTELQALVTAAPDPHTLDLGNGQVLTVSNVAVSTLQSSDFILHH